MKRMTDLIPVEVHWIDICSHTEWAPRAEHENVGCLDCISVGYLIKSTKRVVVIVQTDGKNGLMSESLTIPRSCIKSIQHLKPTR